LNEDEAAFIEDALYDAVRPMLAVSGARLILKTTPHSKCGDVGRPVVDLSCKEGLKLWCGDQELGLEAGSVAYALASRFPQSSKMSRLNRTRSLQICPRLSSSLSI
jgi:hypothetical protein